MPWSTVPLARTTRIPRPASPRREPDNCLLLLRPARTLKPRLPGVQTRACLSARPPAGAAVKTAWRHATGVSQIRPPVPGVRTDCDRNHDIRQRPWAVSMLAELMMCTSKPRLKLDRYNQSCLLQLVKTHPSHGPVTGSLGRQV